MIALAWPVPRAVDGRAPRISDGWHMRSEGYFHYGADIMYKRLPTEPDKLPHGAQSYYMPANTPAVASASGVVTKAGVIGTGGRVAIDHGSGVQTAYYHLSRIDVKTGQRIGRGDSVGIIGHNPSGYKLDHLHFEITLPEGRTDPEPILVGAPVLPIPAHRIGFIEVVLLATAGWLGFKLAKRQRWI